MSLRAGTACLALPAPLGVPMMGYGARTGGAEGFHDPLTVRAVYLAQDQDLLLIECDLCLLAPAQTTALRLRVADRTGVPLERILLGCIHTHSGPDTGFANWMMGREPAPWLSPLFDTVVEAGALACSHAESARLASGHTEARIGRNRRIPDGPLNRDVIVIRVDRSDGSPLAILYVHGCHPTALGHDNLAYSADWPWAAAKSIEAAHPNSTALFLLGAHSDVDPRTRGLLDLAIPGQSVGVDFPTVEKLGNEIGTAVAECAERLIGSADVPIGAGASRIAIPTWPGGTDPDERDRALADKRRDALRALNLEPDAGVRTGELFQLGENLARQLPRDEARARMARVRGYLRDRTAARFAGGTVPEVEAQVLRLGDIWLLGLPLEPTVDVGLDWIERCGGRDAAVVGVANGWMRYLPHAKNFLEPGAEAHYEILQSTLIPEAASLLLARGEELRQEIANP